MDNPVTDFALVNGDFSLTAQNDLATVAGADAYTQDLVRRFETPLGSLFYDPSYGNPLLLKLSQPMGPTYEHDAIADVTACVMAAPYVTSADVQVMCDRENRITTVLVSYVLNDGTADSFTKAVSHLV